MRKIARTAMVLAAFLAGAGMVRAQSRVRLAMAVPAGETGRAIMRTPSVTWTDSRCGRCHQPDPLFSHPINVIPTMAVPSHLPLENGRLTCATCHDSRADAHAAARTLRAPLLRDSSVEGSFCTQCHNPSQSTRASQHGATLGRAHMAWPGLKSDDNSRLAEGFDSQSQACLSCHDGLMSQDIALSGHRRDDGLSEHPIGVTFSSRRLDRTGPAIVLRSRGTLDQRIRLFDDQVGCTSCHSPFSTEPKLLVMSNNRSRLCLSCHLE